MKKYDQFVNESLRDKMTGPDLDETIKKLEKKYKSKIYVLGHLFNLGAVDSYEGIYTLEELEDDLLKRVPMVRYNYSIRQLNLPLEPLYPNKTQLTRFFDGYIEEMEKRTSSYEKDKLFKEMEQYFIKEFDIDLKKCEYIDIDKLEMDLQDKKEQS